MTEPDDLDLVDVDLRVSVEVRNDRVLVKFGHPVWYLSIPSIEARGFAALLTEKANEIDTPPTPHKEVH